MERHPDAEPFEIDGALLAEWLADAGADPDDDALVARVLRAWEGRRA